MSRLLQTAERMELLDILNVSKSAAEAARIFNVRHPERPHPVHRTTVIRLFDKLHHTGSVLDTYKRGRKSVLQDVNIVNNVLEIFEENPHTSLRRVSMQTGHSLKTIHKVLKGNDYHPYKAQKHQLILPHQFEDRLNFCNSFIEEGEQDRDFTQKILWTDECLFPLNGSPNRQNYRQVYTILNSFLLRRLFSFERM